jgi:hypothetical protein
LNRFDADSKLGVQGQTVNATTEVEKVLRVRNSDVDALLLMGRLLPHVSSGAPTQQRLDLLQESAMHHTSNAEIQVCSVASFKAN